MSHRALHAAAFIMAMATPAIAQDHSSIDARVVQTEDGPIDGVVLETGVEAYLGIPYAAPPVRELRWRPPAPVEA